MNKTVSPSDLVTRVNSSVSWAGASQGTSCWQTGMTGPFRAVP